MYAALVVDLNSDANYRALYDLNAAYTPTTYFDGGYEVYIGSVENAMRTYIGQCGTRDVTPLDLIVALDHIDTSEYQIRVRIGNGVSANEGTGDPAVVSDVTLGINGTSYDFQASVTDPNDDDVYYQWNWGDGGRLSEWFGPYNSGDTCTVANSWPDEGDYDVQVRAKDSWEVESDWSPVFAVSMRCCMPPLRGNIDYDPGDVIDIADLVYLVDYMFAGGPAPVCDDEANVEAEGSIDIADLVYLVDYMFAGGPPPMDCFPR